MIRWLNPAALSGFALLALPIVIHLLRAHRAERILFPSLRFVTPSRTAAVRLRLPADWPLLLVRLAIVASAVVAVAQPMVITRSRLRTWNARIVRAVIVDTSAAMNVADGSGQRPLDVAREAAAAEGRSAWQVARIEGASLGDAFVRALTWLSVAPPARHEIVVISGFTEGSLQGSDLANVPSAVGLRFVRVGGPVDARHVTGERLFAVADELAQVQQIELTGPKTGLRLTREAGSQSGLSVAGEDAASPEVRRLWRTVAAAGAPAPSAGEPLVCLFGPTGIGAAAEPMGPRTPRWILRTLVRLQSDETLRQISSRVTASRLGDSDLWTVASVDRSGEPLVRVSARGDRLLMQVGASTDSFMAAAAVRALLVARAGDWSRPDQEILRTAPETLSAWSRPAPEVDEEAWRHADRSDGRWFWIVAVLLLGIEQRLRRSAVPQPVEVRDAA
jgi:hypothetical protein